jgi:hypothetical protein
VFEQLPFFTCVNNVLSSDCQKDISRYVYSKEANTPAYKGSYGDIPNLWIQKYFIIKNAMMTREAKYREKLNNGHK